MYIVCAKAPATTNQAVRLMHIHNICIINAKPAIKQLQHT